MNDLQQLIVGWADHTYPTRTPEATLLKLFEEIGEIASNPNDPIEYADVVIVLLDLAHQHGISGKLLVESIQIKMELNKNRSWKVNSMGVMSHE